MTLKIVYFACEKVENLCGSLLYSKTTDLLLGFYTTGKDNKLI